MNRQAPTDFAANNGPRSQQMAALTKPGRDIAILAGAQILCFLVLTWLEPRFFIIHLYQLIPYVAVLILVGYSRVRWAYMIGPLASVVWLGLAYMAGLLGSAVERLRSAGNSGAAANFVAILAIVTAIVAVLMTALCRIHWVREHAGRGQTWSTFLPSLAIVAVYYGILLHWFWDMISDT